MPIHGRATAFALFIAALAAPALADGTLPLDWAFGNAEGCRFYLTGRSDVARMVVLTADTFTAPEAVCDFGTLVSETSGVFTVQAICVAAGTRLEGNEIVIATGEGIESYRVALEGTGAWGPLLRCPATEQEVLAL